MSYNLIAGDLDPDMEVLVVDPDGDPADLTGASSIQLKWFKPDGTSSLVSLSVISAIGGQLKRVWVAGDTDQVGMHQGRVVVTTSGEARTYPNDGSWIYWWINPTTPC